MRTFKEGGQMYLACRIGNTQREWVGPIDEDFQGWYPFIPNYEFIYDEELDALRLINREPLQGDPLGIEDNPIVIQKDCTIWDPRIAKANFKIMGEAARLGYVTPLYDVSYNKINDNIMRLYDSYHDLQLENEAREVAKMTRSERINYARAPWEMRSVIIHSKLDREMIERLELYGKLFTMLGIMFKFAR